MKIFIINLLKYKSRRRFQLLQAKKLDLDITFIDAVDASELHANVLQDSANYWTRPIRTTDIGCYMSHKNVLEKVSEENNKCLILEDDAILSSNIKKILKTISEIEDLNDCIYNLEYWPGKYILGKEPIYKDNLINIHKIYKKKPGAAGYIISPKIAKKLLNEFNNYSLVDVTIFTRKWINYRQVEPCPIVQMIHINKEIQEKDEKNDEIYYMNTSWILSRFIRLKIILYFLPTIIIGYIYGKSRETIFYKEEFTKNFNNFEKKINQNDK